MFVYSPTTVKVKKYNVSQTRPHNTVPNDQQQGTLIFEHRTGGGETEEGTLKKWKGGGKTRKGKSGTCNCAATIEMAKKQPKRIRSGEQNHKEILRSGKGQGKNRCSSAAVSMANLWMKCAENEFSCGFDVQQSSGSTPSCV